MKSNLTYSIYYTPNAQTTEDSAINYLCYDGKVHIRFHDYNDDMIIIGFEKKLSYLLTYLMNFSYIPKVIGVYTNEMLIDTFLKTSDLASIYAAIDQNSCSRKFKGIKLKPNYKRDNCQPFGAVDPACFPLIVIDGIEQAGNLNTFLSALRISLSEYLFNDSYVVILHENRQMNANKKFINKERKRQAHADAEFAVTQLW